MFLNVIMLVGLCGAAVPLLLHLLARARYRNIDWGAMMFLQGTDQRQQQSTRLRQLILLAMRMTLVALVALAMARPVLSGVLHALSPAAHVDAVIVLDCSGSTAVQENGKARIDLVHRTAISVISQLQRGDRVALVFAGTAQPPSQLSADLQQVAQDAATVVSADGSANIASSLTDAASVLQDANGLNREVYVICDRQATNWKQIDTSFAAAWKKRWEGSTATPRLYVIPVGGEERSNIALESFTAQGLPAVAQQPVELEIRIHNYANEVAADVPVTVKEGDKELYHGSLTVPAEASAIVRTSVQFDSPGCRVLHAETRSSVMPSATARDLAILVTPPLPVLIVSGDEREGAFRSDSDFLKLALTPWSTSGEQGPDPVKLTVSTPVRWQQPDIRKWPVTILANVSSLTDTQARELEQYVYSGGGLIITSGNLIQASNYNQLLFREGSGILPAKLGDSLSTAATSRMGVIGIEVTHPIFRFLRGRPDPVPNVWVIRHQPIEWMCSDTRQLMTLTSGEPLLLERPVGRGKVLLLTSTADADWSTLPLSGLYLPMVQSMVHYLVSSQIPPLNVAQGEPIAISVEDIAEDSKPMITRPDGKQEEMELRPSAIAAELRYARTQQTGRYTLKLKTAHETQNWTFIVQPPADEADLTSFDDKQLDQWRDTLGFRVLSTQGDEIAATVGTGRKGRELWLPLLLAALALCAAELWFARTCTSGSR